MLTRLLTTAALVLFGGMVSIAWSAEAKDAPPEVKPGELGETENVHVCGTLFLAGQPTEGDIAELGQQGIKKIISLRTSPELDWDEKRVTEERGLEFVAIPFGSPEQLTDKVFDQVRKQLREAEDEKVVMHCGSANRVAATWLPFRVLDQGVPLKQALDEAKEIGLRTPAYEQKAIDYIRRHQKSDVEP